MVKKLPVAQPLECVSSNLHQQSRKAGASQHHRCFPARSCANDCVSSQPVANPPQSRSAATNRPTFEQHWHWGRFRAFNFVRFLVNGALATVSYTFLPTSSSKSALIPPVFCDFEVQIELSLQSCALFVGNFARSGPAPWETHFGDPRSHITRKKIGFAPETAFTHSRASELLHFPSTWWWVAGMMWLIANHDTCL